jgi:hypothetical protein
MSKGKAPPPPDYVGAAQLQGELSKEALNMQNYANRPVQNTPFGSTTWGTENVIDPATGQNVTQWTQNTTLAPGLQSALESQIGLQQGRSDLASGFMDRVASEYGQPFDWNNLPAMTSAGTPAQLQTGLADYVPGLQTNVAPQGAVGGFNFGGPQMGVNFGNAPALPQIDSGYRDQVAQSLIERMQPQQDYSRKQLETQLSNQGFKLGSEGYKRALDDLAQRQAAERYNAFDVAGNEAQRLYGMQMGSRQQAINEAMGAGNFANQAQSQLYGQLMGQANLANQASQQAFGQNLSAAQFGNQALGQASALDIGRMQAQNQAAQQQFALNQQYANQMNQLRQQAIAEQMQRRGMSLNEMNALLTGQQVGMPQMPSFNASGRAETPNILGATQMGYDAALGQYNANQAGANNLMGGLFSLGAGALSGGLFGF